MKIDNLEIIARAAASDQECDYEQFSAFVAKVGPKTVLELCDVVKAARNVCDVRYSDGEWDDLDKAIGQLISALLRAGVEFKNPRIGK